eukprot:TRINITY_DN3316_c0_g1_i2.p1 TRINITY_DN3316_c0_g1~~TRINITY_DN3316_c0_g1_i2.p1  ORF type:complete len:780 (-),score=163.41 TRINITY_DN3316_c0_g1_i2:73-2412(-)
MRETSLLRLAIALLAVALSSGSPLSLTSNSGELKVQIGDAGDITISVDGEVWFTGGPAAIHTTDGWYLSEINQTQKNLDLSENDDHSRQNYNLLVLLGLTQVSGNDPLWGPYVLVEMGWMAGQVPFNTSVKFFKEIEMAIFEQHFMDGVESTGMYDLFGVVSSFPTLVPEVNANLRFFTFQDLWDLGTIYPVNDTTLYNYRGGKDGGVPISFYKDDPNLNRTLVLSPFNNFPVAYQAQPSVFTGLACGVAGTIDHIPAGYRQQYIIYLGDGGVSKSLYQWGDVLLQQYGKERTPLQADIPTTYLGYWTDNGAYYYYLTEANKTYEDTMMEVHEYHESLGLPVKYFQFDSWWYYKGNNDGVKEWNSRPDIFPSGISAVQKKLGLPLALHNRYWSNDTVYQDLFPFVVEPQEALPESEKFWDFLMDQALSYGCVTYEQDWLIDQFQHMNITQTHVHTARKWLNQMGKAALKKGITIQYCMPLWPDYLQSVEIQSVTQIRASNDYNPNRRQWPIGKSSILAWSLGLLPFKDDFWSVSDQPGNPYDQSEPNPELQALVSILSAGLVGPSDKVGYSNFTLVMQTCRSDGVLLKPDRPSFAIQATFLSDCPTGELYHTYSNVSGIDTHYVMSAEMTSPWKLQPKDIGIDPSSSPHSYVYYDYHDPNLSLEAFDSDQPIMIPSYDNVTMWPMDYYVIVPVLSNGFILLGETEKFVTMSSMRVSKIQTTSSDNVQFQLQGQPGESVQFRVSHSNMMDNSLSVLCHISPSGTSDVSCTSNTSFTCNCS